MSTIIIASVFVPLSIIAAAIAINKIEQNTTEETEETKTSPKEEVRKGPPGDLVDLSGGMLGI